MKWFPHIGKKFWFEVPKPTDLKEYVGRFVRVKDDAGKPVVIEIERVVGSLAHTTRFQIDSKGKSYTISMLDFYAQMNGEKVSDEEIDLFEQTTFEIAGRRPQKFGKFWV